MILRCNYEELQALTAGGRSLLQGEAEAHSSVLAPEESRARVEALLPRLVGDLSVASLAEARGLCKAVDAILAYLRAEMEAVVVTTHAADEEAVAAYFDFAHALSVSHRLHEMLTEMEALVELVTGERADAETARTFRFPD
ncbi:MAG: hypothetical protein Q8N53_00355 [Longimicrobiales bacterium]|nr:hypothetical protein [Longimicrobiales bacterium]